MSCAETAEAIHLPFGLWTGVGLKKHKFNRIHRVAPVCPPGKARWRHLVNTIEPSVCSGDAVMCQITAKLMVDNGKYGVSELLRLTELTWMIMSAISPGRENSK